MRDGRLDMLDASAQPCERQCKASTQKQFSFLKSYLVGPVAFRLTSVVTGLSIRDEGENSRVSTNDSFTENTGYDQIQDTWRGRHSVADIRNAGIRTGGYPGAGFVRVLLSQQ